MKSSTPSVTVRKIRSVKKTKDISQRGFLSPHSLASFETSFRLSSLDPTYASALFSLSDGFTASLDLSVHSQRSYDHANRALVQLRDALSTLHSRINEAWPTIKANIETQDAEMAADRIAYRREAKRLATMSKKVAAPKKIVTEKPAKVFAKLMADVNPSVTKKVGRPRKVVATVAA